MNRIEIDENKNFENNSLLRNNNKKIPDYVTEQKSVDKMAKNSYQINIDISQEPRPTDIGKKRENKIEYTKTSSKEIEAVNKKPINLKNNSNEQKINVKRYLFKTPNSNYFGENHLLDHLLELKFHFHP